LFDEAWRNSHRSAAVGGGDAGEHCDALDTGLKVTLVLDVGVSIPRSFCLDNIIKLKHVLFIRLGAHGIFLTLISGQVYNILIPYILQ